MYRHYIYYTLLLLLLLQGQGLVWSAARCAARARPKQKQFKNILIRVKQRINILIYKLNINQTLEIELLKKKINKYLIHIPVQLDFAEYCPSIVRKRLEYYAIILNIISRFREIAYYKKIEDEEDRFDEGYKSIASQVFVNIFTRHYIKYIDEMIAFNLIERDNSYSYVNHESKSYRINPKLLVKDKKTNRMFKEYEITNQKLVNKMKDILDGVNFENTYEEILYKNLCSINIDYDGVIQYSKDNKLDEEKYQLHMNSLQLIENKQFRFHRDDYGRIHTNITNMKKCFRKFLYFDEKDELMMLDIKNCQTYCFAQLFNKNFRENHTVKSILKKYNIEYIFNNLVITENIQNFINAAENGLIYESLMTDEYDRDAIKKMYMPFFYCKFYPNYSSPMFTMFETLYPNILNIIIEIKRIDYKVFSRLLQALEAFLMIDVFSYDLVEAYDFNKFTLIHDSFLFVRNLDNEELVRGVIATQCHEIGIHLPTIKDENLY